MNKNSFYLSHVNIPYHKIQPSSSKYTSSYSFIHSFTMLGVNALLERIVFYVTSLHYITYGQIKFGL